MKEQTKAIFDELIDRYPKLSRESEHIKAAFSILLETVRAGGVIVTCGNGGSAADADHITGELLKGFRMKRPLESSLCEKLVSNGLPAEVVAKLQKSITAVNLSGHDAAMTATGNDLGYDLIFAQQMLGFTSEKNCLIGISTSGNSANVVNAGIVAKTFGIKSIALTGRDGGKMNDIFDVNICVPEEETAYIQELHLPVYHALCAMLEREVFDA